MSEITKKTRDITVEEITYGQCPAELTITFNETVRSVNLNKIIIGDITIPGVVSGLKLSSIQTG